MQDIIAAKYAKQFGHDVIFKDVNYGDAVNPEYRPHEATVLDEKALLHHQAGPILTGEEAAAAAESITRGHFGDLVNKGIVTEDELSAMMQDVRGNWQHLVDEGYDPVYVPFTWATSRSISSIR
jgi:hypothetical protein